MAKENALYMMITLQQLFAHKERTVREKAVTLAADPRISSVGLTMSELLTHKDKFVQIEADALYQELMSFEDEKGPASSNFEVRATNRMRA